MSDGRACEKSSRRRSSFLVALGLLAACSHPFALVRADDAYRVSDPDSKVADSLRIDALPGGALLSSDWREVDSKRLKTGVMMHYKQVSEDGQLFISVSSPSADEQEKSLPTLAERVIAAIRLRAGSLAVAISEPAASVAIDGAEAEEMVISLQRPGDFAPVTRTYLGMARSLSSPLLVTVSYGGLPGQFDNASKEARGLFRRLRFEGDVHLPKPTGGAPQPKTGAPAEPKRDAPHSKSPPGAAQSA